jgi:hypothetical protein
MLLDVINEIEKIIGKSAITTFVKRGVTVEGRYLVCLSYSKSPLFLQLMKSYQQKFNNDPKSKYRLVHVRNGNFLLIEIGEPCKPKDFIKSFGEYALDAKIVEMNENEYGIFVIIKPFNEIVEEMLCIDLKNCGFEIVDNFEFIIAMARNTD